MPLQPQPPRAAGREGGPGRAGEDGAGAAARGRAAGGTREDGASGDSEEVHPEGPGHEESGPQWGGQLRPGLHGECPFSPAPRVASAELPSPLLAGLGCQRFVCGARTGAGRAPSRERLRRACGRRGHPRPSASFFFFHGPCGARPAGRGVKGAAAGPSPLRPRRPRLPIVSPAGRRRLGCGLAFPRLPSPPAPPGRVKASCLAAAGRAA